MRYVSIDLETTGLDPEACQVLQIGAVVDDLRDQKNLAQLPRFCKTLAWEEIHGTPFALHMNAWLIHRISLYHETAGEGQLTPDESDEFSDFVVPKYAISEFRKFLASCGFDPDREKINVAGKNFTTFDLPFLKAMESYNDSRVPDFHRRVIDPAILFLWGSDDALPGTEACMRRANISGEVSHDALADALDVVRLVRAGLKGGKP